MFKRGALTRVSVSKCCRYLYRHFVAIMKYLYDIEMTFSSMCEALHSTQFEIERFGIDSIRDAVGRS